MNQRQTKKNYFQVLEVKNYKEFDVKRDHISEQESSSILQNQINKLQRNEIHSKNYIKNEQAQQKHIQDMIQEDKKYHFDKKVVSDLQKNSKGILKQGKYTKDKSTTQKVSFEPVNLMPSQKNASSNKTSMIRLVEHNEVDKREEDLYPCPEGCGRNFGAQQLDKHVRICKKLFQNKRPKFDISKKREYT